MKLKSQTLFLSPPLSCSQMQSLPTSNYTCGMGDAPVGSGSWHKINQRTYIHTSISIKKHSKNTPCLTPPYSLSFSLPDYKQDKVLQRAISFITIVTVRMMIFIQLVKSSSLHWSHTYTHFNPDMMLISFIRTDAVSSLLQGHLD